MAVLPLASWHADARREVAWPPALDLRMLAGDQYTEFKLAWSQTPTCRTFASLQPLKPKDEPNAHHREGLHRLYHSSVIDRYVTCGQDGTMRSALLPSRRCAAPLGTLPTER